MKQLLAIFFLIVFSFQVVPVKVIGKLLSKAQTTENVEDGVPVSCDDEIATDRFSDDVAFVQHYSSPFYKSVYYKNKIAGIIHRAEDLIAHYVADVQSPPPDVC